ncbi:hypothetical protein DICPUDRAFT_75066 [Dictyostelium purpureum]|uniref:DUF4922 domain-containing protein n=1 Tax=Dictyostelium purpureum TaxID=5786 RepID=F0Z9J3_DICPU|nr:uncharacterized protein DICPUDRAFT_75066 [Dictyostelium purpureum]EGC39394.1 hypothetical protein DICPUDRAFT_75066 [Dictyostelium purpureum]|eukprot:XP_003284068.1 hypothetical protein DICPUDRAFT_75066 [Dictyostelium purpureum]
MDKEVHSQEKVQKSIDKILKLNRDDKAKGLKESLDYLYEVSRNTGYIREDILSENIYISENYENEYGVRFDIMINCSRPEIPQKNNHNNDKNNICNLCLSNLTLKKELRVYEFKLKNGKELFKQFSPFPYHKYHNVIIDKQHTPQVLSEDTIKEILELCESMPGYTVLCNSDKEFSGVSNIHHAHYQGGYHDFAIYKAQSKFEIQCNNIEIKILHYPAGCIKVVGQDIQELEIVLIKLYNSWRNGKYESLKNEYQSFSFSCKYNQNQGLESRGYFEFIMIPRNGEPHRFNTRKSLECIKKEMVGIGEISGNGNLPGRLKRQLFETYLDILTQLQNDNKLINIIDNVEKIDNYLTNDLKEFSTWFNEYFIKTLKNFNNDKTPPIKQILEISLCNSLIDIIMDNSPIKNDTDLIFNWINQSKL